MATEEPKFSVLEKTPPFELRSYAPMILAEVQVEGDLDDASSKGFRLIAAYIFGQNQVSEKIAMTAPVMTTQAKDGTFRVSFVIPSEYSIKDLPAPNQKAVTFSEMNEMTAATVTFSGYTSDERVASKIEKLQEWMSKQNLTPSASPIIARYDPPWKPGFLRKNEIHRSSLLVRKNGFTIYEEFYPNYLNE